MEVKRLIDICIDRTDIEKGALLVLKEVRPTWKPENIKFEYFTGGISNTLVGCYEEGKFKSDVVNIRIYGVGTEEFTDREEEQKNWRLLHASGLAPPLYASFQNGIAYGYIQGKTLDVTTVRQEKIRKLIAKEMCRMHSSIKPVDGKSPKSALFELQKQLADMLPDGFDDLEKQTRFEKEVKPKPVLLSELKEIMQLLLQFDCPVVFCHNDLLLENIIYNSETETIRFIDYEFAFYNFQSFEIANHFCEHAGVEPVDYSLYPDKDYQLIWIRDYLGYWNEENGKPASDVSDFEVERMYAMVNKCALCSHLLAGFWSLFQAGNSTINFDFLGYAISRLNEYFAKKDEFLFASVTPT